jgi:hypothetical protein
MKIVKINDSEYRLSGTFTYYRAKHDKITQDGKVYTNTTMEEVLFDCDADFSTKFPVEFIPNNNWGAMKIDYDWIGLNIKVYYPNFLDSGWDILQQAIPQNYSSQTYIRVLSYFLDRKSEMAINLPIKGSFISKSHKSEVDDFKHLSIEFPLQWYGFNNCVYILVPFLEILKLDFSIMEIEYQSFILKKFTYNENDYIRYRFWLDLIPKEYYQRKLTEAEITLVLAELYKRKVELFSRAKRNYPTKNERNKYIIQNLSLK